MDGVDDLTKLSAVIALLLLRELIGLARQKKAANGSGDKSVDFWDNHIRTIVRQELKDSNTEVLKDTSAIRQQGHAIINNQASFIAAAQMLISRLEKL